MNYNQNNIWATDPCSEAWPDDSSEASWDDDQQNRRDNWGMNSLGATKNLNKQFNVRRKEAMGLAEFGIQNTLPSPLFSLKNTEPINEKRQDTNATPSPHSDDGATPYLASRPEKHGVTGNAWGVASKSTNPTSGILKIQAQEEAEREKAEQRQQPRKASTIKTSGSGYVPPHKRGISSDNRWGQQDHQLQEYSHGNSESGQKPNCTVRVGELPESTTEVDLSELCRQFGRVLRVHIVTDRETKRSKGYAFVTFSNHHEAAMAVTGLEGKRHDYRILRADWARPRENRPTTSYRSGYGKALPQTSYRLGYGKDLPQTSWRGQNDGRVDRKILHT